MSKGKDILGSSTESDESFEGFSTTEMMKKLPLANSHRSSLELGILVSKTQPNQELIDLHAMPMVGLTNQHLDLIVLLLRFTWILLPK